MKEEIIALLKKHKDSGVYVNPEFLSQLNDLLYEFYEFDDDEINKWIYEMWSR